MRSILCPVDRSPTLDDRVETALALARVVEGHVTFQIAAPLMTMTMWEPFGGAALSAEAINTVRAADERLASALDARLAPQDVAFDVIVVDDGMIEGVATAARFTDLIVTSLDDMSLQEVALGVQVPVLAVPKGAPLLEFNRPVVIAWDGGHEAAAAMRAALPLLRLAGSVHVLTVREHGPNSGGDSGPDFPAADAARYLSRHDIHAQCHEIDRHEIDRNGSVGETIAGFARDQDAGLIVMGLFGKSRLREFLMGGVSRTLLNTSPVALLLAH